MSDNAADSRMARQASAADNFIVSMSSLRSDVVQRAVHSMRIDAATAFAQRVIVPWDVDDGAPWSAWRIWVAKFALSNYTEVVLNLVILCNFGLIIFETDQEAKCYPKFESKLGECSTSHKNISWLAIANDVLLGIYTIEAILLIYVLRLDYFKRPATLFDFVLCALSWLPEVLQSTDAMQLTWLRIVRCVRIVRVTRFSKLHEVNMLISGFKACMSALFFGSLILLSLLCFFSIIAVQIVHPYNSQIQYNGCTRCNRGFQSVGDSMLTLYQQIIAGDGWGAISVPVVERTRWGLMLPVFQLVIGLGAMNLILAVVVDQAMEARENNRAAAAQKNAETHMQRKIQLLDLVREMDRDTSGDIDHDEFMHAAQTNHELQTRVALAGLRQEELKEIVDSITSESAHTVGYMTLCNVLDDIDAVNVRKTVVLTKLILSSMQRDVNNRLDKQSEELTTISRKLDQILVPHLEASPPANAGRMYSPTHSDTEEQDPFTVKPDSRISCQHSCPLNVSTDALDFRLRESIMDKIQSCRAELDCETKCVQQSLARLDTKWSASLRALEETSFAFADSAIGQGVDARSLDHAIRTHQVLEQRRRSLSNNFIHLLEDDLRFWTSDCSFVSASGGVHADHERPFYEKLIHSRRSQQTLLFL